MKSLLQKSLISLDAKTYITLIIILAPILNFLSGITIDIYSPSLPAISNYFAISATIAKNTISVTLLGWAFGALVFGVLIDSLGRKNILLTSLAIYIIASFAAPFCHSIDQLMLARFIQGFAVSAVTIGCRTLVVDNVTGPRYAIAILYTSIGYGLGPIIGPFIGGILQHYFDWQANFYFMAISAILLLSLLVLYVKESIPEKQPLQITKVSTVFFKMLKHQRFMAGLFIMGLIQIQLMIYPTLGPFFVEGVFHKNALVYGNTALIVGCSYLIGTFINRFLLRYNSTKRICYIGCCVLIFGILCSVTFALLCKLTLFTLMLPIMIICMSAGLIFANLMGQNLKQFPNNAGIAMAIQAAGLLLIATLGIFIISHYHFTNLIEMATLLTIIAILELILFFGIYQKIFQCPD